MKLSDNLPVLAGAPFALDNPRAWRTYLGGKLLDALHGKTEREDTHFPEEWIASTVTARNAGREHILDEGLSHPEEAPQVSLQELIGSDPAAYLGAKSAQRSGSPFRCTPAASRRRLCFSRNTERRNAGIFLVAGGSTEKSLRSIWAFAPESPGNTGKSCSSGRTFRACSNVCTVLRSAAEIPF